MFPRNLLHLTGRRLLGLAMALAMTIGLISTAAAPTAHADPNDAHTQWTWQISDLQHGGEAAERSYWDLIARLHDLSGHRIPGQDRLAETTNQPARLIEIRLQAGEQYWGSLYFWADNLYLAGFYQPSVDGSDDHHYAFPDTWPDEFSRVLGGVPVDRLPFGGNYNALPGGSTSARQQQVINAFSFYSALGTLRDAPRYLHTGPGRETIGRSLVTIIQATSEAARFARIFDNIRGNMLHYTANPIGADNVVLEQNWDHISNWVYRALRPGDHGVLGLGSRTFSTLAALLAYVGYMELSSKARK
ncbi:ribosome-inactivating family protein [Streptomyces sp. NPDC053048]|uniref:ribosome-inactivating family protein n=1 Tax=Streptomyces sp. NPDC053048 TaxID=3365694 RepID=UPI0037D4BFD0